MNNERIVDLTFSKVISFPRLPTERVRFERKKRKKHLPARID